MANNDFFLNFGSNAKTWASGLSGELKPATSSINELTTALERYDAATENRKTNGPLDSLFTRLDQVSQKFADLTGSLASTFDKAIEGIGLLKEDMANLLSSVKGVNQAAATAKRGAGRPNLTTVDENDAQSAAKVRNAQTLKANLDASNRQIERLARLNQTLAEKMENSGDKTIILRDAVDGLRTAASKAITNIDGLEQRLSRFGENVVINSPEHGGVATAGAMADIAPMLAAIVEGLRGATLSVGQANIEAARMVTQVETAAKATTDEALETRRYTTTERSEMQGPQVQTRLVEGSKRPLEVFQPHMWDQPAQPGRYAMGTQQVVFRKADIIPGETFNQQYARVEKLTKSFNEVQRQLPTATTLDPKNGALLQKISDAFFSGGGVYAEAVKRGDRNGLASSASLQETVTRNPGKRFLAGAQDEKVLKQATEAGLGTTMQQVVEKALEFTHQRRVGTEVVPGEVPAARQNILEQWISDRLTENPHQTFGSLGSPELNAVRRQMDERIIAAGGGTESRGERAVRGDKTPGHIMDGERIQTNEKGGDRPLGVPYAPTELPTFLRNHPDPQALYLGALARTARSDEGREFSAGLSAQSQGRREMSQATELFRDTGREHDTSLTRDRRASQYAPATLVAHAQERLEAAQRAHEEAVKAHAEIMEDVDTGNVYHKKNNPEGITQQQIEAAKARRLTTSISVENQMAQLEEARAKNQESIAAKRGAKEFHRDEIKRYDEVSENTRKAREVARNLPNNLIKTEQLVSKETGLTRASFTERKYSDQEIADTLGLKSRTKKATANPERTALLEERIAASQAELAQETARSAAAAKHSADRAQRLADAQNRVIAATAEAEPALRAESALRQKALDAREKWAERQRAKGVTQAELNEGTRTRNAERRENGGFSSSDLAAERRYVEAKNARLAEETAQQERLEALQAKARADRQKVIDKQLRKGVSPDAIRAEQVARNTERLTNGGFSSQDLPSERRAIEARLSTPQGRYEQANRELDHFRGIPAQIPGGSVSRLSSLQNQISEYTKELAQLGAPQVIPPKITDAHREAFAQKKADERAALIRPELEKFGIPAARAATLAYEPNDQIAKALLEAAAKMDEAAGKQQKAADKAEAAADKADGFGNTPAQRRLRKGQTPTRIAPYMGEDGEMVDPRLISESRRERAKRARAERENENASVPYSDIYPGRGADRRLGPLDLQDALTRAGSRKPGPEADAHRGRIEAAMAALGVKAEPVEAAPKAPRRSGATANAAGEAAVSKDMGILRARESQLIAEHERLNVRKQVTQANIAELGGNRGSTRATLDQAGNAALDGLLSEAKVTKEELSTVNSDLHNVQTEIRRLGRKLGEAADEVTPAPQAGGGSGGGGGKKPRRPAATGGGGDDEPSDKRSNAARSNDAFSQAQHLANFANFSPEVQAAVRAAAQAAGVKQGATLTDEQKAALLPAVHQFRDDPAYPKYDAQTARRTFAAGAGLTLPGNLGNQRFLIDSFNLNKPGPGGSGAASQASQAEADAKARLNDILAGSSGRVREALTAEFQAQERLNRIEASGVATAEQLAGAKRQLMAASRGVTTASNAEANGGGAGGLVGLLQRGGQQAVRFASFQIAFTGLEKVRELVDTGIQAQTQFIRLQANLEATGRSANGLMQALGDVSSQTAQPLAHTIQAASELTGVLKTRGDLIEGSKVASELANISHGMLTATQAAIGLRDVTDAYGLSGVTALRGVGDMIARVSQVTGVSVHDVIEGTTQLAQEAHSFGLNPRQAAVLAADVTKNTGESGEAAAEQVSRILSTFNNGKVQQLLAKTVVPETSQDGKANPDAGKTVVPQELFNQPGGIATGLTQLLQMYDQLAPAQQHAIDSLVGTGRQARALTGLLRDAATAGKLLNDVSDDQGALAKQNANFLKTLGGAVQKLGADFRNLGADLMQAHVFDVLMLIIGGVDKLMTTVDAVFRVFDKFNDNPLTKSLLQMLIVLGEVSLAFKVFGGEKSAALGMKVANTMGMGGFFTRTGAIREEQAAAAAAGTGPSFIPFARTRAMGGALGESVRSGRNMGRGLFAPSAQTLYGSKFYNPDPASFTKEDALGLTRQQRTGFAMQARYGVNAEEATVGQRLAVGASSAARNLGQLTRSMGQMAAGVAGPIAAFALLDIVIQQVSKAVAFNTETQKQRAKINDYIAPPSDPNHGEKTDGQKAVDDATKLEKRVFDKGKDTKDWWNPTWHDMWQGDVDVFTGNTSHGNTSKKFDKSYEDLLHRSSKRILDAGDDPKKVAEAQKAMDKDIADHAKDMEKSAGDKDAQAVATAEIANLKRMFDDAAQGRAKNLSHIADLDQLTLQQLENMQTFLSKASSMDTRTIRTDPGALSDALDDTGVSKDSRIGKLGAKIASGEGALDRAKDMVEADKLQLPQLDIAIRGAGLGTPDYDRLTKTRDAVFANLQQQFDLVDSLTIQNAEAFAGMLQKIGNLPAASGQLGAEQAGLKARLNAIDDPTDSNYQQALGQLATTNENKAHLDVQGGIDAANLDSARHPNSVTRAKDSQTVAQLNLDAARTAAKQTRTDLIEQEESQKRRVAEAQAALTAFTSTRYDEGNAQVAMGNDKTQAGLAANVSSAQAGLKAASALVGVDATEKAAAVQAALASKAQADEAVTQSLQSQLVAANNLKVAMIQASGGGTLAMDAQRVTNANQEVTFATKEFGAGSTEESNAKANALQAGIQQKADTQAQNDSTYTLRAAVQANAGDQVGAARTNLSKANNDLTFAIRTYGRDSKEANDARAAIITANATLQKEMDDAINASLDLQISMLSNRGNDADKRQILKDKEQQAQNNLNAFKARGGDVNSAEGQRLQAQVNDAHRNTIQQGVQIQIDTLDYMRETFQISSSQEVEALRQILKNKQLTQDQVRAINLQILQLQQQLSGEFNIGDIVKPTFYQARRSVQGGYSAPAASAVGAGMAPQMAASQSVVNNNSTSTVTLNGVDFATVKKWVQSALGTTATSRYGTTQRKGSG